MRLREDELASITEIIEDAEILSDRPAQAARGTGTIRTERDS